MKARILGVVLAGLLVNGVAYCAEGTEGTVQDAVTASGDKVRLLPNGRWEYVDAKKAEAQRPANQAYDAEIAREQGGLFGIGRKVKPGDPDYNRGSLNPKLK